MCTAITLKADSFYFGRNLDLDCGYNEKVCITPCRYPFVFRNGRVMSEHYPMIGMATVSGGYPLYYEATNGKGLSMAGLNFPDNAVYYPESEEKENITPFEFIPYILGLCADVDEAVERIEKINLWNNPFSKDFPLTPLHWIIADKNRSVTVEPMKNGLEIYENPVGVLTNNPPFGYHLQNLTNYIRLSPEQPENSFCKEINLAPYSLGMGAIGLPGDLSSASRFVRASFTKLNSAGDDGVSRFFHILTNVSQPMGLNRTGENKYEYTLYSSCCDTEKGIYYYTTYGNRQITAVDMNNENLNGKEVISYELIKEQQIFYCNFR